MNRILSGVSTCRDFWRSTQAEIEVHWPQEGTVGGAEGWIAGIGMVLGGGLGWKPGACVSHAGPPSQGENFAFDLGPAGWENSAD